MTTLRNILVVTALLLTATAGTANAQPYPLGGNTITATDTSVAPGGTMVLGMQICQPGTSATFDLESVALGTATVNGSGVASLTTAIPSSTSVGTHSITGSCTGTDGAPLTLVLSVTIGGGGSGIPVTGSSNTLPMTQIAIGAIVAGGLIVLMANKRRNAKHHTDDTVGV